MATRPKNFPEYAGEIGEKVKTMRDQVAQTAQDVKEMAADVGRKTVERLEEQRQSSARTLENAATSLHDTADNLPGVETVASVAHATADKIEATADYMRNNDLSDMVQDVAGFVRRYPGRTIAVAVVAGFLVGRALRND